MCLSQACPDPTTDHGDARNITVGDLAAAATAGGLTVGQVQDNVGRTSLMGTLAPQKPKPMELFRQTLMRPDIVVDIDGVLAFLAEAVFGALNARFGTMYDAHTMRTYWVEGALPENQGTWLKAFFDNPWTYVNLAPDLGAVRAINKLHEAGFTVIIATDRPTSAHGLTETWLSRWGVEYDRLFVGPGSKESLIVQHSPERPMVLFDDSPQRIPMARLGVTIDMPLRPWTPKNVKDGEVEHVMAFDDWAKILKGFGVPA